MQFSQQSLVHLQDVVILHLQLPACDAQQLHLQAGPFCKGTTKNNLKIIIKTMHFSDNRHPKIK